MLYLDGISIRKLKEELKTEVEGKKVGRIYQYSKLSLAIFFGKTNLYFSANANLPICYIKTEKEESLDTPMNFSLNLRKNLLGATLIDIDQLGFDRILVFKFRKLNELGELKIFKVYFEIMGKHSNLILTDENNRILDLMKKFSIEENKLRPLLPGVQYEQPILAKKLSPTEVDPEQLENFLSIPKGVMKNVEGVGRYTENSIKSHKDLTSLLDGRAQPRIYFEDRRVVLGGAFDFKGIKANRVIEYPNINDMINSYITLTRSSEKFSNLFSKLASEVDKGIKRGKKTLKVLEKDMIKNEKHDGAKEAGDILAANLFAIKRGMEKVVLFDFYNNCERTITLDSGRSPKENLDRYYKKYSKLKRGYEFNLKRWDDVDEEIKYLEGLKKFLEGSSALDELESIEEELIQGKYLREVVNKRKKKKVKHNKYGTLNHNGYEILYGRTNLENDNLTHRIAARDDMWLHAKDVPGGHVIIRNLGDFSEDLILKGAEVAAYLSKAAPGEKLTIDYTLKKNLKKPKGAKPGFVIYHVFQSVVITKPESI